MQVVDILKDYPAFQKYERKGLSTELKSYRAADLPAALQAWAFDLCKRNMEQLYVPVWGWSDKKKTDQLTSLSSRYLVATTTDGDATRPVGFVNFR